MTWQGVPWAVAQATHSHEVARLLAYMASGGGEGVVTPQGCAVRPLSSPGLGVRIKPGAITLHNRALDADQQNYLVRNPDEEIVPLTAAGATRYDLVCVLVEDPQYPGQPVPANVPNGPYVRTRVYTGVGPTADSLEDVDPGQTGYALARVAVPTSGVVTKAEITDLRGMAQPRIATTIKMLNLPNAAGDEMLTSTEFITFPELASWDDVWVPPWATRVLMEMHVSGMLLIDDEVDGGGWGGFGRGVLGTIEQGATVIRPPDGNGTRKATFGYMNATDKYVPRAMRGTMQTLKSQARQAEWSAGGLEVMAGWGTTVILRVVFIEEPDADYWES